jgi:hypothetical protein
MDEGTGLLRVGTGLLKGEEILAAIAAFPEGLPDPARLTHALVDLTAVTRLEVSNQELQSIVAIDGLNLKRTNLTRATIAAPTDLTYGVSRMYRGYSRTSSLKVEVFRTLEAAKKWLYSTEADRP